MQAWTVDLIDIVGVNARAHLSDKLPDLAEPAIPEPVEPPGTGFGKAGGISRPPPKGIPLQGKRRIQGWLQGLPLSGAGGGDVAQMVNPVDRFVDPHQLDNRITVEPLAVFVVEEFVDTPQIDRDGLMGAGVGAQEVDGSGKLVSLVALNRVSKRQNAVLPNLRDPGLHREAEEGNDIRHGHGIIVKIFSLKDFLGDGVRFSDFWAARVIVSPIGRAQGQMEPFTGAAID